MLSSYFAAEVDAISRCCLADVKTAGDWNARKDEYRRQLAEMLGLWPEPPRGDLHATVTGALDHPEFTVEKLHFQSLPYLYVTADLFIPKNLSAPAPAILYVCGHSEVKKDGISYGNKTAYQHHGEWFARNGYVCLVIDTIQLGEIEGHHHGTYREGMWWWQSRGYTPAGVETWNGIRAIDFLCSRKEVDPGRIGMTGRSGGGAYTWYVAAMDQRVRVAAPVAGITDLRNHIVDGCIEGHCDCMYMVNTYRWDFAQVAALIAPRPLLIGNSDKDTIFPLDGVNRVHDQVRRIYKLLGADANLGLLITEGPHQDTQDLQVPVFRWFNRFLKNDRGTVDKVAVSMLTPQQLRVFDKLPQDQVSTTIQETFVPAAPAPKVPENQQQWETQRNAWKEALRQKTFRGWPQETPSLDLKPAFDVTRNGTRLRASDFTSQHDVQLRLYIAQPQNEEVKELALRVLGERDWTEWRESMGLNSSGDLEVGGQSRSSPASGSTAFAWLAPRGVGPTVWSGDAKKQAQILRRFALLGQTLEGMRVWDICRAMQAIRSIDDLKHLPLILRGQGAIGADCLYATLFEPPVARLELSNLPRSHAEGPQLLNVLQMLDLDAAIAMAAERCQLQLHQSPGVADYATKVAAKLGWSGTRIEIRPTPHEFSP
jgi:dienelactone hydrolase